MEGLGPGAGDWGGKAMLAVRPRPAHRIGALGVLSFLVASALLGFLAAPVRGDAPIVSENSNASRTVTWTMGTATGLTLNGVDLEGANATLPWVPANVSWDTPAKFLARGSIGPNLVANATDISDRKSTRLNSSHVEISYAVFCLKKKNSTSNWARSRTRDGPRPSQTPIRRWMKATTAVRSPPIPPMRLASTAFPR